jgi:formate dehydrogenase (coenzyme F420) alpha subunit
MEIISNCIYCAQACKLKYNVEKNKVIKVMPVLDDPISKGKPCIKGLKINEVMDKNRIKKPMIRIKGKLKEVTWDKALNLITQKLKEYMPNEIFLGASGKIPNEDNYIIQKFARLALKTNNVDCCSARLCHLPTAMGFNDCLGITAPPGYYDDILGLDCLFIIGSNPASNHPVNFNRILEMKSKGGKVIVISPNKSKTAEIADLFLQVKPGAETALLNYFISYLLKNTYNKKLEKLEGFEKLKTIVKKYTKNKIADLCEVDSKILVDVAKQISQSKKFGVMHGMGLTQHVNGVENVHSLVNLVLLKEGKIVTDRGEINVQGSADMLTSPCILEFSNSANLKNMSKIWKGKLPFIRGMSVIEAIALGQAKIVLISNFNPAHSMPDLNEVHKILKKIFLVQMESYFNLTSEYADIILPVPLINERSATLANGERLIRKINSVRKGFGKSEWQIYSLLAKKLKTQGFAYKSEKQIFNEITKTVKAYENLDSNKIYLGKESYADKKIKFKRFIGEEFEGMDDDVSKQYPFIFFTFRSPYAFLSNEATGNSKTLKKLTSASFFINPKDALKLKLKDKNQIKVKSKVGFIQGPVSISESIKQGTIGANFHYKELLVNKLFPLQFDEETFTPNFKSVAVKITKV